MIHYCSSNCIKRFKGSIPKVDETALIKEVKECLTDTAIKEDVSD